jgi:hypothetical protein
MNFGSSLSIITSTLLEAKVELYNSLPLPPPNQPHNEEKLLNKKV